MNVETVIRPASVLCATYLLHSTLLLGGIWLLLRLMRLRSSFARELLWKWGALAPLATTSLQLLGSAPLAAPLWRLEDPFQFVRHFITPTIDNAPSAAAIDSSSDPAPPAKSPDLARHSEATIPASDAERRSSPDSLVPSLSAELETLVTIFPLASPTDVPLAPLDAIPQDHTGRDAVAAAPASARSAAPSVPRGTLASVLLGMAGLLASGGLLRLLWQTGRVRQLVRESTPVREGHVFSALHQVWPRGARRIDLRASSAVREPSALGVFQWTILVPAAIDAGLDPNELRAVLAHEVAHLQRRDPLWLWLGQALTAIIPWQPLNALAWREWRKCSESLCDDWAIEQGHSSLILARGLTIVAQWKVKPAAGPGLTATGASLTTRVESLLSGGAGRDPWRRPQRRRLLAGGMLAASGLLFLFGPRTTWSLPPQPSVAPASAAVDTSEPAPPDVQNVPDDVTAQLSDRERSEEISAALSALQMDLDAALSLLEFDGNEEPSAAVAAIRMRLESLRRQSDSLTAEPSD